MKRIPWADLSSSTVLGAFTSVLLFNFTETKWSDPHPGQTDQEWDLKLLLYTTMPCFFCFFFFHNAMFYPHLNQNSKGETACFLGIKYRKATGIKGTIPKAKLLLHYLQKLLLDRAGFRVRQARHRGCRI